MPVIVARSLKKVENRIVIPTVEGLKAEGIHYIGFIYFGLIKVNDDPYVIEYNVRLGDPETEAIIPRIKSDLLEILVAAGKAGLSGSRIAFDPRTVSTVMLVSGGYPGEYEKGKIITGFSKIKESILFHAGTKKDGDKILTAGGRVLAVSSYGKNLKEALENSYKNAEMIDFNGKYYRKDIGFDL